MRCLFIAVACSALLAGTAAAQVGSPAGPVPVERLAARRAALLERIGTGVAIVRSAEVRSIEGDYPQDSDYRENNDFFYLTGLEAPDAWLVLEARDTAPDRVVLYLPERDPVSERWTGPTLGPGDEASARTGITEVRAADSAEVEIRRRLFAPGSAARRGALYLPRRAEDGDSEFLRGLVFRGSLGGEGFRVEDVGREVAALRLVKDADELARLRKAIAITAEAQRAAMAAAAPGMWEYELEALIEYTFRRRGAERVGFPSIVGAGVNSTTLHYDESRGRLETGDLVVADIGAEFGYYSADVTRTFPVAGRFTKRQLELYRLVLGTQQAAIDSVRPGTTVGRLNAIARSYMRAHSGDLCGGTSCERYFVHGLSHWLGMDVHDVGDYTTPLAPGMVLTIEPGIYIPEERIGIRIEDDVLVTAGAPEVLSADAPRQPQEIEAAMRR